MGIRLSAIFAIAFAACTRGGHDAAPPTDRAAIAEACGSCHVYPAPSTASKAVWQRVVPSMYRLAKPLHPGLPPLREVLAHFVDGAPERLALDDATGVALPVALRHEVALADDANQPEVTCLRELPADDGVAVFAYCDTARRGIGIRALGEPTDRMFLRELGIPVFASLVDVDHDGLQDLLVADLGSAAPEVTTRGRVLWIRATSDGWEAARELVVGLGRVVGAALADLDGDGRDDLVVAEFGAGSTGGIYVYPVEQLLRPLTSRHAVDVRAGAVKVQLADVDHDSRLDVVAAIAQQHEQIVVFYNRGRQFSPRTIFSASTPGWGLVDLEVVDFDRDGDLDAISANGDTLDTHELRPYHGAYLHRQDAGGFVTQSIGKLPGAYALEVADLDGDGDLDVAACAFIHPNSLARTEAARFMSVAWFETRGEANVVHAIDIGDIDFISLALTDMHADGHVELVVGKRTWAAASVWSQRETAALVWYQLP